METDPTGVNRLSNKPVSIAATLHTDIVISDNPQDKPLTIYVESECFFHCSAV